MHAWNERERIEEYDTRDENVMCVSFLFHVGWALGLGLGESSRDRAHVALCMHDKEGGNPKTSLEIEGTKPKKKRRL